MRRRRGLWLLLPSVFGVALWLLTVRSNNPPLSAADLQLRAAIAGADRMEIHFMSCQQVACSANVTLKKTVVGRSLKQFQDDLRLLDSPTTIAASGNGRFVTYELFFYKKHLYLAHLTLFSTEFTLVKGLKVWGNKVWENGRRLHPRFENRLQVQLPSVAE